MQKIISRLTTVLSNIYPSALSNVSPCCCCTASSMLTVLATSSRWLKISGSFLSVAFDGRVGQQLGQVALGYHQVEQV